MNFSVSAHGYSTILHKTEHRIYSSIASICRKTNGQTATNGQTGGHARWIDRQEKNCCFIPGRGEILVDA